MKDKEIDDFFSLVSCSCADFIAIRDMRVSVSEQYQTTKVIKEALGKLPAKKVKDFEKHQGSIEYMRNAVELILKYRYDVNWQHEVRERYLSIDWSEVEYLIKRMGYIMHYYNRYTPKFHQETIEKDLGLKPMQYPDTHVEIIYKKKK